MNNPLIGFNWGTLYQRYDSTCKGYYPQSPYLYAFENRPTNDRFLYYQIIERIKEESLQRSNITIGTYEAIMYWKLSSQRAAITNDAKK